MPLTESSTSSEPYAPPDLQLRLVQLIHRHGERTPVHGGLTGLLKPEGWDICRLQPFLHAWHVIGMDWGEGAGDGGSAGGSGAGGAGGGGGSSSNGADDAFPAIPPVHESLPPAFKNVVFQGSVTSVHETQVLDQLKLVPPSGLCFLGQLTDVGKDSLRSLGAELRKLYVHQLAFLPPRLELDHRDLFVRSTDYARTVESVQYLLDGLYPPAHRAPDLPFHIHTRTFRDETMYPHPNCPKLMAFTKAFSHSYGAANPDLVERTLTHFQGILGFPPVPEDKRLKYLYHLYDYLICTKGNGMPLPPGIQEEDVHHLESFAVNQWYASVWALACVAS
jgi:acid phosphatase